MKKLTTILIISAIAGGTAWILGTKQGKAFLEGFKDNVGDAATKLKSQIDSIPSASAELIKKSKSYLRKNGAVHQQVG